jgi:altronate dehydratase small subunit
MNEKDNVATTLRPLQQGEKASVKTTSGSVTVELLTSVPPNHKFAIRNITSGEHIVKFGEVIGITTQNISTGTHVHTQNLRTLHGRGSESAST